MQTVAPAAYIAHRQVEGSALDRTLVAAEAHGWSVKAESYINIVVLKRRSKTVRLYADNAGRILEGSWTSSSKSRNFIGRGKAQQILDYLAK